jgi:1-aminocyclopropane-1-carboxylate deaminase/D-cysteine desulfhydrase-like pyridoxal-dependent ACC family enzyme
VRALLARYPRLALVLPRVDLGVEETPVERWQVDGATLLAKRDDLSASLLGGNKVRALELLLAGLAPGDSLLTAGATGSTHALAVAEYGARIGVATQVVTWPQETHAISRATAARLGALARVTAARSPLHAYLYVALRRLTSRVRWVPAGASVPLGALGHVSAGLELAAQLARDGVTPPDLLVAPLGSGGTVAGLLVGLALAGLPTRVVGVRVVPRVVANRGRVLRLARHTRRLVATLAGEDLPPLDASRLIVDESEYGGAYARETASAGRAAEALRASGGPALDGTYSAKAFAAALALARTLPDGRVLYWLTFDGRWLGGETNPPAADG